MLYFFPSGASVGAKKGYIMPVVSLIISEIKKLPSTTKGQVDYFDTKVKGLFLRVGMNTRTFFVKVSVLDPATGKFKAVIQKVGRFGEITPEQARERALKMLPELRKGKARKAPPVPTLAELMESRMITNPLADSTAAAYRRDFAEKFPEWGALTIDQAGKIPPDVILDRFDQVKRDNGPAAALISFQRLQAVLNYARLRFPLAVPRNPCEVLTAGKLWPKAGARADCLRGNEFKTFYSGIQAFNEVTRDALIFALYHGLRSSETSGLLWSAVDLGAETIHILLTKNKRPLHVPLSRQSLAILKRRRAGGDDGDVFVFPGRLKPHICKSGHVQLRGGAIRLNTGLDITPHGLRRSFVTIGKQLHLHEEVERLINHIDSSVTGRHYDGRDLEDLRGPLQQIADEIERLMCHGVGVKKEEAGRQEAAV